MNKLYNLTVKAGIVATSIIMIYMAWLIISDPIERAIRKRKADD